ncbi:ribose-phosphate diphosphokinase [Aureibacter tunicatorum]|uniref:Ribose-phosphate pyrophosphokinase n=1 Tax=Aureibacter tunicatorum TaxID=866807 RepID=A0AAE3XKH6_9BACT|nr:ribose-phosphate diphosphokinase [Aureibacter tunicatorum]MDR6237600.1 ribose-phosphate pyrophosphokinase [Aureibacter tunicatorum]BDD02634.1 ribose-phosphate pyrophosphokinase [Aureibacter tunicatorum]
MILNLDSKFNPTTNQQTIDFESFVFAGGEPHIKIKSDLTDLKSVIISTRIRSFNDIGMLLVAVDALRRAKVNNLELILPYFPGARQDRVASSGEALTAKVYADLINAQNFDTVTIFDAHSDVSPALINNCVNLDNSDFIRTVIEDIDEELTLIAPDSGASKKIHHLAEKLAITDVIECSKSRNPDTRELSEFKVYADDLAGKPCLVVDDICDGGRTFIGIAKALKKKNAGKIYLAVSHGIFSWGFDELNKYFEKIFCTDSFQTLEETNCLKQIPLTF